jgi:hypothetical protein
MNLQNHDEDSVILKIVPVEQDSHHLRFNGINRVSILRQRRMRSMLLRTACEMLGQEEERP